MVESRICSSGRFRRLARQPHPATPSCCFRTSNARMPRSQKIRKRRTRTGCLTCRTRRVKCDEGRPSCKRCHDVNVECAGYEDKRRVDLLPRLSRVPSSTKQPATRLSVASPERQIAQPLLRQMPHQLPCYSLRDDGLPLVGLPNNPKRSQLPCSAARAVLGYNQYLFGTASVLFGEDNSPFWRQHLCQEAWGAEYLFLAITALGNIHRARLQLSAPDELDGNVGQDTQIVANQNYTRALECLSHELRVYDAPRCSLAAAFVLLAYFEVRPRATLP